MHRRKFLGCCACATTLPVAGVWSAFPATGTEIEEPSKIDVDPIVASASNHFMTKCRTCSESILAAGCEAIGIESELVPDIALGLGGGIGMQGETCGVLTGGALVISLAAAKQETEYKKKKLLAMQMVAHLHESFEKQFGHTDCRSLSGLDLTTEEGRKKLESEIRTQKCAKFVKAAATILAKELKTMGDTSSR